SKCIPRTAALVDAREILIAVVNDSDRIEGVEELILPGPQRLLLLEIDDEPGAARKMLVITEREDGAIRQIHQDLALDLDRLGLRFLGLGLRRSHHGDSFLEGIGALLSASIA